MSQHQPPALLPIPLHPLRDYGIDANGQVWRLNAKARSGGGKRIDKPLSGSSLLDLSKVFGRSHSNRDKAPHLLLPGIWQLRPFSETNAVGWRGNIHDYLSQQVAAPADQACWFQISLPGMRRTPKRLSFCQASGDLLRDSRDHYPFIIMGAVAFGALLERND